MHTTTVKQWKLSAKLLKTIRKIYKNYRSSRVNSEFNPLINQSFQRQLTNSSWLVESRFTSDHTDQFQKLKGSYNIHGQNIHHYQYIISWKMTQG